MASRRAFAAAIEAASISGLLVLMAGTAVAEPARSVVVPLTGSPVTDQEAAQAAPRALPMGRAGSDRGQGRAYGTWSLPYTTRGAYARRRNGTPTQYAPFRATGRLVLTYSGGSSSSCTASVIRKGLIVTAAHCVWSYGNPNSGATSARFEPARFGDGPGALPYGHWDGTHLVVPLVFQLGTDECASDPDIMPFACANDIALIVMAPNANGQLPGEVVGQYREITTPHAFTWFNGLNVAQITQLGYPRRFDNGLKMIRTDSIGYYCSGCNQIRIGSAMTQGSSGGPWIINFGIEPETDVPAGLYDFSNRLVGVTGWGYLGDHVLDRKVMGASRFGRNSRYPDKANITDLIEIACQTYPGRC